MAKYHCCTLAETMNYYKQDIKGALRGVEIDHDSNKEYPISKKAAEKLIIETFDDTIYHLMQSVASANVMQGMLPEPVPKGVNMLEYIAKHDQEFAKLTEGYEFDDFDED